MTGPWKKFWIILIYVSYSIVVVNWQFQQLLVIQSIFQNCVWCDSHLPGHQGLIPGGALKPVDADLETTFDVTEYYWFPMLAGLSDLTLDSRSEVRNCALEVLFDLLNERGHKFSSAFWESIFHRVLFPLFDHVRHAGRDGVVSSGDEWLRETSIHSLQLLCNLFNTFYKVPTFSYVFHCNHLRPSYMLNWLRNLLLSLLHTVDSSIVYHAHLTIPTCEYLYMHSMCWEH